MPKEGRMTIENQPSVERSPLDERVRAAMEAIESLAVQRIQVQNAEELQALERRIVAATDQLASALLAQKLQAAVDESSLHEQARQLIKSAPKKLKHQGRRTVTVRGTRGPAFTIETSYYSPNQQFSREKK
jgi:hypothetical protein